MPTSPAMPPVERLLACVDELAAVDATGLSGAEQAELLRAVGRAEAKLAAVRLQVLAAAEHNRTGRAVGAADTGQWAASVARLDQPAAHRQVGLAQGLADRRLTRDALAEGELSAEHAEVIVRADRMLPGSVTDEKRATVEARLVEKAKELAPAALRRVARRALAQVESDISAVDAHEDRLVADEEADARAKTRLSLHDNGDGTVTGVFTVPVLHGHLLRKILETMTAPRRARLGASAAQAGDSGGVRTDWKHARGLAFCQLVEHLPTDHLHGRTAATVIVTLDDGVLRGSLKAAGVDIGDSISSGEARRLACNAGIMPAVLGGRSHVLDLGHLRRLFSDQQRIALGLVFKTCAADGCERPYAWCELHHRQPWSKGGRTDLSDAVPLCHFHHQRIHDPGFRHRHLPDGSIRFHERR